MMSERRTKINYFHWAIWYIIVIFFQYFEVRVWLILVNWLFRVFAIFQVMFQQFDDFVDFDYHKKVVLSIVVFAQFKINWNEFFENNLYLRFDFEFFQLKIFADFVNIVFEICCYSNFYLLLNQKVLIFHAD